MSQDTPMSNRQIIKKFFEPAIKLKKHTLLSIIFAIIRSLYSLASIILIQEIIEHIQNTSYANIGHILILYGIIFVVTIIFFLFTYDWRRGRQIYAYDNYIQKKYLQIAITLENNSFENIGTGRFIGIIKNASEARSDLLTNLSLKIPSFLLSIIYSIYLAQKISYLFLVIYLLVLLVICLYVIWINKYGLVFRKYMSDIKINLMGQITKMLMSKIEIIIYNKLHYELNIIDELNGKLSKNNIQLSFYTFFTHEGPRIIINSIRYIMVIFIVYSSFFGNISLSSIIGFMFILGYVDNNLQEFANIYQQITKKISDIEKLRELEYKPTIINDYFDGRMLKPGVYNIKISGVSFGYHSSYNIIQNLSLDIQGSTKTALVGPSGGGKSTIIKLIAGYIRPDSGTIYIDDQALPSSTNIDTHNHISLQSYYKHIGYLTQEPSVFDGSIRENLLYGNIDINDFKPEYIDNIIKLSRCEWIYDLPDGLDTHIGEKGIKLSGGQRQRLAIAKIMIKNPDIILLDEPTSALDSENEELVTQALDNLFQGKTVIIIAHRLQTVKHADQILYIAKDKDNHASILERGTHTQLLDLGGHYYKMVELQSGF